MFAYIGDAETAKRLAGSDAKVLDYGENYIYPGFLEAHTHGYGAGYRAIGQADLSKVPGTDYAKYREMSKMMNSANGKLYAAIGGIVLVYGIDCVTGSRYKVDARKESFTLGPTSEQSETTVSQKQEEALSEKSQQKKRTTKAKSQQ